MVLLSLLCPVLGGCSQALKPVFEPVEPPIVWPPAPNPARIVYVGQLGEAADLKPAPKPFQFLTDLVAGAEPPRRLYGPRSVIRSEHGAQLWVADPGGRCVHLLDLEQRTYRKLQKIADAHLLSPVGVCNGPGNSIYVCDSEGVAVHRLDARTGALIEALRLPEDIRRPVAVSYHAESGELFVVDVSAHDIKVLSADGDLIRVIGHRGAAPGEFNYPCALANSGDLIWVADAGNNRVQALTLAGVPVRAFGQAGDASGDLALPKGVACDSDGHVYVVDARFENVQVFDRTGQLLLAFGEEGTGPGQFWLPAGIFIDPADRIWICDSYNSRIQVFDYLKEGPATQPNGRESPSEEGPAGSRREPVIPRLSSTRPAREAK